MRRNTRQGLLVLLLALGLLVGSLAALCAVWRNPGVAVIMGMTGLACALCAWAACRLIWRLAPRSVAWRRLSRGMLYLSPYTGGGRLLEEYQAIPEDAVWGEEDELCRAELIRREGRDLVLTASPRELQRLELREGDQILLSALGLFRQAQLVGTLTQYAQAGEPCTLRLRLTQGLLPDQGREFLF